ncbi:hypothetical protein [Sphingomonas sp. BK069]|uniref:hypothetical protein n=1 Tax=Sphingomonas sp. BK069 TaxID=2586979 RepID=UPI00161B093A|nr:hypothetical protein [Sphingomonas sp. BK069]MBB3349736.1 hypothetical protein [Sphingomonas sp. BK069]
MLPASIAPTAAPSAVATVQELLAEGITDILLALLQAARATGATRIDVAAIGEITTQIGSIRITPRDCCR